MALSRNLVTDDGAVGNGVANDTAAFTSFKTWALANQDGSLITLTIPAGGYNVAFNSTTRFWVRGITKLLVSGTGATVKDTGGVNPPRWGGDGQGIGLVGTNSARTATAYRFSQTITLLTAAHSSIFTIGRYAIMTGLDLQGQWDSPFGYPTNHHYFEYVRITDINAGTGVITIETALRNTYKSTWPCLNSGSAFQVDAGGPATLYPLPASWDAEFEYRGLTIDASAEGAYAAGRVVTWKDVNFSNTAPIPSQNLQWNWDNCSAANNSMEVDKLITEMNFVDGAIRQIQVQSSSVDLLTIDGTDVTVLLNGTAKRNVFSGAHFAEFRVGAFNYGAGGEVIMDDCIVDVGPTSGSINHNGIDGTGLVNSYEMSGGVISVPLGTRITNVTDNGSGAVRLTVNSTAPFTTGKNVQIVSVGGATYVNGTHINITVIDGTHIDLTDESFSAGSAYTSGGLIEAFAPPWAVPGATMFWSGLKVSETAFRIVDVTQDTNKIYVKTNLLGGFPSVPASFPDGEVSLRVCPAPRFTARNCTGSHAAVDLSGAPTAGPLFSYSKRTYSGGASGPWPSFSGNAAKPETWGTIVAIKINVIVPYTGVSSLTFNSLGQFNNYPVVKPSDYSSTTIGPIINAKIAGERVLTPTGTTGTQSGDSGLTLAEAYWMTGVPTQGATFSRDISGESQATWPTISVEITTEQGVLPEFSAPLRLRLHA